MHQGLRLGRQWLALVLVLFCLPLFVGLRSLDLETDEAIYSFGVERMLVDGEWLKPKSSPEERYVFLEKPPLKFWIVTPAIKLGLLPENELGFRFWDAGMGAAAFIYVFAIGSLLAGPVCGIVALLMLFVHWPLVLDHGLRTNNMEAALFLSYCGGIYHFLRWADARTERPARHAVFTGLFFVLGFMTKFIAVVFLPAVIGGAALLVPASRSKLLASWRLWLGVTALAAALILPWFIYAWITFGSFFWFKIFGENIVTRFAGTLVATHLRPWDFYFTTLWMFFTEEHAQWLVAAGSVLLIVQSIRRRSLVGLTVVLWAVPLVLISAGSSKLYHYAYPFLPPFALAVGYLAALIVMLAPVQLRKLLLAVEAWLSRAIPRLNAAAASPVFRKTATVFIAVAAVLAIWALVFGGVRLTSGRTVLFKSSGVIRPIVVMLLFGVLTKRSVRLATFVVALVVASYLPLDDYRAMLPRLTKEKHPLRDASECVMRVQAEGKGTLPPGMYVDTNGEMWHPIFYYFHRVKPWVTQPSPSAETLDQTLHDPAALRPSLVQETRYREYLAGPLGSRFARTVSPPMISLLEYQLILPGPYSVCSSEAPIHTAQ